MSKKCGSVVDLDEGVEIGCALPKGHDGPHACGWRSDDSIHPHTNYRLTWEDNPAYVKPKRYRRTKAEIAHGKAFLERATAGIIRTRYRRTEADPRPARRPVFEALPEPVWIIV